MPPKSNLSTLIRGIQGTPLKITDQGIAGVFLSNATSSGLATENTAISILNAIVASNQDIEVLLVRDAGAGNIVIKQVRDYVGGITTYEDVNGNSYVPVGPLEYLDPSAVLNLILTELQAQGLTLNDIDTNTDGLEALLTTIDADTSNLDVPLSTIAKEATLELIRLLLVSLDGKDFATELTLSGIKTQTDLLNFIATALEVNVTSSVLPTGAATEATLGTLATEASLGAIKVSVGTDSVAHGAAQKGIRALGTDGTNDQQISTDVDGKVNVLVQNPSPIPVSGTVTVNQPVTVDSTDLDIRDLSSTTDSVEVLQDTHDDLNANANLQVGDVDVSGTNPVPVSFSPGVVQGMYRLRLSGITTHIITAGATSMSFINVSDVAATFTDSTSTVSSIEPGEEFSFEASGNNTLGSVQVDTPVGSEVVWVGVY